MDSRRYDRPTADLRFSNLRGQLDILRCRARPAPRRWRPYGERYRLFERVRGENGREALESFIATRFRDSHEACVRHYMPALIGLEDSHGELRCAIGYRSAAAEPLFLEQYLNVPIEHAISAQRGAASAVLDRPRLSLV
jgi:hypothetical protein